MKDIPAYLDSVGMFNDTKVVFINPTMTRKMQGTYAELGPIKVTMPVEEIATIPFA